MFRGMLLAAAVAGLVGGATAADEAITIKVKKTAKGESSTLR